MNQKAFSLVELLVGVAIVLLLVILTLPVLRSFDRQKTLDGVLQDISGVLRVAQSKTVASEGSATYGVYFDSASSSQKYVLFKGTSYETRDPSQDQVYNISSQIELYDIQLSSSQIVFQKITGSAQQGSISLRLKSDLSQTRSLFVDSLGKVEISLQSSPSDSSRVKDSRHVHLTYVRPNIQTSETVTLTFPNGGSPVTQQILISSNMAGGQLFWEGDVNVGGQTQHLRVQTHLFNDITLGTQFSIHRDKRYNTKDVNMSISGDTTGSLIQYDVSGQTTQGTSIYVQQPILQ